ncbi:ATP-binding protein [Beijerinckia indica]|uniref:histidine kinase n=1 Tax=Beijerinckia indica subsp. indica (strain ATCC 9039 / DSM 1715 / NCIMB 8712) TaxID=395963 RepID=B2IIX3_BEII9|nr:ATP-binding protein [Beijerinckia indica]ACB96185.1 integral membrane sensor signal transduction histidine kinase [Beijerinckia indica subsp. indica ATCC 9039]
MKLVAWPRDTIARRFAVTIILAVMATLTCVRLFFAFGGVWAQPELQASGLLGVAAGVVRVIDAAPPQMRQALVAAATTSTLHIDFYISASPVSAALENATDAEDGRSLMGNLLSDTFRTVVIFEPNSRVSTIPALNHDRAKYPNAYFLAVKLTDRSWLVFTVLNRLWGLSRPERWALWLVFLVLSITIVSAIAARQLSRPVEQLAEAAHLFGINPHAPAIAETGPQELRQVIKTFNAMQGQIQKFVADRTTMLAAISHDLRTPLTRIRLRGEFIEDHGQRTRLFRDVDEMQAMVDGALAFFRDDALEEDTTIFDLPGVILTIVNDYADQNIGIGYTGPSRVVYRGRPFALKRAFTNLIENAIKYGTPPEIELSCEETTFIVSIRDRGPGIPPDAIDRVFRPYFRLEKSRNRTTGGVGLGLTVAQAIVQGHGGEIILYNRPGGGLEARITLAVMTQSGKGASNIAKVHRSPEI